MQGSVIFIDGLPICQLYLDNNTIISELNVISDPTDTHLVQDDLDSLAIKLEFHQPSHIE